MSGVWARDSSRALAGETQAARLRLRRRPKTAVAGRNSRFGGWLPFRVSRAESGQLRAFISRLRDGQGKSRLGHAGFFRQLVRFSLRPPHLPLSRGSSLERRGSSAAPEGNAGHTSRSTAQPAGAHAPSPESPAFWYATSSTKKMFAPLRSAGMARTPVRNAWNVTCSLNGFGRTLFLLRFHSAP